MWEDRKFIADQKLKRQNPRLVALVKKMHFLVLFIIITCLFHPYFNNFIFYSNGNKADLDFRVKGARFQPEFYSGDHLLGKSRGLAELQSSHLSNVDINTCPTLLTGLL